MKKITGIILAVCTALFIAVQTAFSAPADRWEPRAEECLSYYSTGASPWDSMEPGKSDWAAYCLARLHGSDGAGKYAAGMQERVEELSQSGGFVRPTEYQRSAICIAAAGGDASRAVELGAFRCETLDKQGFNAYIWALIAVNVTGLEQPENAVNTAQSLAGHIMSQQHADGSFSLIGDSGDVDITAAAVYALSGCDADGASEAAKRGAEWLGAFSEYSSMGTVNCESTAQAVIAFCSVGNTPKAQEAASQLEEYRRDGGYAHLPDGEANAIATAQALEAFTALALSERGEALFGRISALPGADITTTETADAQTEQAAAEVPQAVEEIASGLTGKHIKLILSLIFGAGAAACMVVFFLRSKKLLIPALLLAAAAGGVWLLDIRTPQEYYAQGAAGPLRVTVSADCTAALSNMELIAEDVNPRDVIPSDGVVIKQCEVALQEGSSAFDALTAAAREQHVRVDYTGSVYGTYVRGIGYIQEFGFGELSGWLYKVNGEFPDISAAYFTLNEGDVVEFVYTCSLGSDVGNVFTADVDD